MESVKSLFASGAADGCQDFVSQNQASLEEITRLSETVEAEKNIIEERNNLLVLAQKAVEESQIFHQASLQEKSLENEHLSEELKKFEKTLETERRNLQICRDKLKTQENRNMKMRICVLKFHDKRKSFDMNKPQ